MNYSILVNRIEVFGSEVILSTGAEINGKQFWPCLKGKPRYHRDGSLAKADGCDVRHKDGTWQFINNSYYQNEYNESPSEANR